MVCYYIYSIFNIYSVYNIYRTLTLQKGKNRVLRRGNFAWCERGIAAVTISGAMKNLKKKQKKDNWQQLQSQK
jgi:hypothetical protein